MSKGGCQNKYALFIRNPFKVGGGGGTHCEINVGHYYWHPIITMSFPQYTSSEFSPIIHEEFGEHMIRDQRPFFHTVSFQILQIHSSMLLLLFSSPHSFSKEFRSDDWDGHGKSFLSCSVSYFCVDFDVCFGLLSWWKIQPRSIIRLLTETVSVRFFLSVGIWHYPLCHESE